MSSDSDVVISTLLQWCNEYAVHNDARICIARGEDGSICVRSRNEFIEPNATLVSIPKTAILSIRNSTFTQHIPQVIYGTEGQLGLALALYGELLRGRASPWFGYLQSLPSHVRLPIFWNDADEDEKRALVWIKGTMAEVELSKSGLSLPPVRTEGSEQSVMNFCDYYESTVLPALATANLGSYATLEGFKRAYSLVSSRAFIVDVFHGLAMVPIADAFNHSLENQIHLESDSEVCRICGSLSECSHDADDDTGGDLSPKALLERISNDLSTSEDTCEMVTNASITPFTEVFNTYGEQLSNAQLLVRYGFLLDVNENDVISWDTLQLRRFAVSFLESAPRQATSPEERNEDLTSFGEVVATDESSAITDELAEAVMCRLAEALDHWAYDDSTFAVSSLVYYTGLSKSEGDRDTLLNIDAGAARDLRGIKLYTPTLACGRGPLAQPEIRWRYGHSLPSCFLCACSHLNIMCSPASRMELEISQILWRTTFSCLAEIALFLLIHRRDGLIFEKRGD